MNVANHSRHSHAMDQSYFQASVCAGKPSMPQLLSMTVLQIMQIRRRSNTNQKQLDG